jgi:hypothetical protein
LKYLPFNSVIVWVFFQYNIYYHVGHLNKWLISCDFKSEDGNGFKILKMNLFDPSQQVMIFEETN